MAVQGGVSKVKVPISVRNVNYLLIEPEPASQIQIEKVCCVFPLSCLPLS